jgi:carbon-monoxide dehydrogenase medium subunit
MWDTYLFAASVDDALRKLGDLGDEARVIAGGTDLVLQAQRGQCLARAVVDITRIPGLDRIEERNGYISLGALVTHAQVAASDVVRARASVLARACSSVGGPQIRNVGTLVGNVVNALPAADGAVALYALDAEAQVATLEGRQWMPLAELYEGVGVCTLDPCVQIVTALRFRPLSSTMGCDYQRLARRRVGALPTLNTAAVVGVSEGRFREARISVGPVATTPFRAVTSEQMLVGSRVDDLAIAHAARQAACEAKPRSSVLRGSSEYRTAMVEVLVRRALAQATAMADAL